LAVIFAMMKAVQWWSPRVQQRVRRLLDDEVLPLGTDAVEYATALELAQRRGLVEARDGFVDAMQHSDLAHYVADALAASTVLRGPLFVRLSDARFQSATGAGMQTMTSAPPQRNAAAAVQYELTDVHWYRSWRPPQRWRFVVVHAAAPYTHVAGAVLEAPSSSMTLCEAAAALSLFAPSTHAAVASRLALVAVPLLTGADDDALAAQRWRRVRASLR
jgi:hypothetical protein